MEELRHYSDDALSRNGRRAFALGQAMIGSDRWSRIAEAAP